MGATVCTAVAVVASTLSTSFISTLACDSPQYTLFRREEPIKWAKSSLAGYIRGELRRGGLTLALAIRISVITEDV